MSPIYHHPKPQKYPGRHFIDPSKAVIYQPEVGHSAKIEIDFLDNQFDKEIETNFLS